ncbi:site-specific integrase [Candidatus Dojkabacteria bacterium]|jgi:integrase|nr:site-specific integrase [Candidatus Dojkabacteria bacterium]
MHNKYYLKTNQKAFFRPKEWLLFYEELSEKQKPYFTIAINTGARINEIRHLRVKDIDFSFNALTFYITKVKARKGEKRPMPRTIKISKGFKEWLFKYIKKHNLSPEDTFDIPSTPAIKYILNRKLQRLDIRDWKDFSSHNVRKTHGNWLLACGMDGVLVASRLGHDMNTLLKAYVSPDIFSYEDKVLIKQILGDILPDTIK